MEKTIVCGFFVQKRRCLLNLILVSLKLQVREKSRKTPSFDLIICSYAEGAQGDSNAVSL